MSLHASLFVTAVLFLNRPLLCCFLAFSSALLGVTGKLSAVEPINIRVSPSRNTITQGDDLRFSITISAADDRMYEFPVGSFPSCFGVYILGPWGAVQPDPKKIRSGMWMNGQMSASKKVVIKKGQPYSTTFKLSDYYSPQILTSTDGLSVGRHQVNVKFFPPNRIVSTPIDSGPIDILVLQQKSFYEKTLARKNVSTEQPSLAKYLRSIRPTPEQKRAVEALIIQLGDDSFDVREKAMNELRSIPWLLTEALKSATRSTDAEVRDRSQRLIELRRRDVHPILYAALQTIAEKKIFGLTAELLDVISSCREPYLRVAAERALLSSLRADDVPKLCEGLRSKSSHVRVAAATALSRLPGNTAQDDLLRMLEDRVDQVKVATARTLAIRGNRKCLPVLLAMLKSNELQVRLLAATTLRDLTGKHHGFAAYDSLERRAKGIARWKDWIDGEGKTAEIKLPLKTARVRSRSLRGHTLVAFGNSSDKVAEYDPRGNETWTYTARNPRSAEKLSNGNILIAEFQGNRVVEVNTEGRIVWQLKIEMPLDAKPLANGNVLIAQYASIARALEVNRAGEVVWQHRVPKRCTDVHRLANGNTLISSHGGPVQEVTPGGSVVWEYAGVNWHGCQPLPSGNVLITSSVDHRVIEVTRGKRIVWECRHSGAVDAFRLPNGNTLISGSNQMVEMTPKRTVVWSKGGSTFGTVRR